VGVTGSSGKTTVSWLVRGLLEEMQQLTGMVGSIEYALAEDRWGAGLLLLLLLLLLLAAHSRLTASHATAAS
jgi:hypothetical protein